MSIIGEVIQVGGGSPYTGQTTVSPSTSNVVLPTNKKKLSSNITVYGDTDMVASNIRNGVNLFGISGNVREYGYISKSGTTSNGQFYIGSGFTPLCAGSVTWSGSSMCTCYDSGGTGRVTGYTTVREWYSVSAPSWNSSNITINTGSGSLSSSVLAQAAGYY